MAKEPVRVLVIGAANRIGYALVPMIARGKMLGADQPVILHMLEIPLAAKALKGVKMELIDAAFPLLKGVVATTDVIEACTGVNVVVILECFGRLNDVSINKSQLAALEKHAAPNCKVLVIDNPVDTNALLLKECAPSISEKNITYLTRLDHNMALGQISERLNVPVSDVKNVIIWGNYSSSTLYPDVNHATITTSSGEKSVRELVKDNDWLNGEFITKVQQRGVAVIKARGLESAISIAGSACDHIRDWVLGTPEGTFVSMGVYSDGSYSVSSGLIYSFPVTCRNGEWTIVQELVMMPPKKIEEMEKSMEGMQKEISKIKTLEYEMGVMRSILEDIRMKMVEDEHCAAKAKASLQEEASGSVSEVVMQTRGGIPKEPSNLQSLEEWVIVQELVTMSPKKIEDMEKSMEGMQKEIRKIGAVEHEMGVMRSILVDIRKKMDEDEHRAAKTKAPLQEEASGSISEVVMQTREGIPKEPSNLQSPGEWVIVQGGEEEEHQRNMPMKESCNVLEGLSTDEVPRKKMMDNDIHVGSSTSQQSSVPNSHPGSHSTSARQLQIDGREFTTPLIALTARLKILKARKQSLEEMLRKSGNIRDRRQ